MQLFFFVQINETLPLKLFCFSLKNLNFSRIKFHSDQVFTISRFVVVIAQCRVQYGKYFPSFSYFATYFTSLQVSEITAKYGKQGKYGPILHEPTCNNYFIVKCLSRISLLTNFIGFP